jgi:hypothetical protein
LVKVRRLARRYGSALGIVSDLSLLDDEDPIPPFICR